jgi:uncharacterized membrane protein HdeD (DUF308 family)
MPHRAVLLGLALAIIGGFVLSFPQAFWDGILMIFVGAILIIIGIAGFANRIDPCPSNW